MKYVLSVDQSTQGTKSLLFDEHGTLINRYDLPHEQIINDKGWVSHNPEEIYVNTIKSIEQLIKLSGINADDITCMGITNQRETSVMWDRASGEAVCDAIVWQCNRAADICTRYSSDDKEYVYKSTGIPLSPFFPAAKLSWIIENIDGVPEKIEREEICLGTVDTWLLYKFTNGESYKTDYSNASRTQLFNISSLEWDQKICDLFNIPLKLLPEVCDSDSLFGVTTAEGIFNRPIPIYSIMGDSHAALFGQGCVDTGSAKATYGTGTSVMMNIGEAPKFSSNGLITTIAWKRNKKICYAIEGNINYSGAVITWLKNDLRVIASPQETEKYATEANPNDTTYLVPAFTGLGAPYWNDNAKAVFCGMSRLTGMPEIIKATLDSIAYQITDVVKAIESDVECRLNVLMVDGGATKNNYLMKLQCNLLNSLVKKALSEELSGIGVAYSAGISFGLYDENISSVLEREEFVPEMQEDKRNALYSGWKKAVKLAINS